MKQKYIPPHRRNQSSTRQSDSEYCDHSDSIDKFPKTRKMISLTSTLSEDPSSVCSTTNSNYKTSISVHEKQSFKPLNELSGKALDAHNFKANEDKNIFGTRTNCAKFALRQSDLEYCDHSNSINEFPETREMISSTNALSDDNSSIRSSSSSFKENISKHEMQSFRSLNELTRKALHTNSFENNEDKNMSVTELGSEESFDMYNTASDLTSDSIIFCNENRKESDKEGDTIEFKSPFIKKEIFTSNIKPVTQSLPVVEMCDEINNLSISISKGTKKVKRNVEQQNKMNQSISALNTTRKVYDDPKKEKNNDLLIQRILNLANVYLNVTFKTMLSELYSKKYSEHIPSNVLQETNFLVVVDEKCPKAECVTPTDAKVISEKSLFQVAKTEPKSLTSKDIGDRYLVKIYNCKSVTEIWGKIIYTNNLEKLDKLLNEMRNSYNSDKLLAFNIKEGSFYVVFKDHFWHRVKCLKCSKFTALVLLIDQGDEFNVPVTEIYELHQKFVSLPAQAIKMSLSDLEAFSDCDEAFIILKDMIHEKTLYATSTKSLYQYKNNCWNVQLYLNIYEENINIADLVIEQLMKTVLNPKCSIQTETMIHVHVSSINEKRIFVQLIESKSYAYFMKVLRNIVIKYLDNEELNRYELKLNENKMYLLQNPETKTWYRAKILKLKNGGEVEATLIDTGSKICINKEDFIPLEKFSSILTKYPEQAIEVQVHELSNFYEHETLEHFRKIIQYTNTFFASFITKTIGNNIPTIRLFKKESDNSLTPINDTLFLNQKSQIESTNIVSVKERKPFDDILTLQMQRMSKMRELQRSLSLTSLSTSLDAPRLPKDLCDAHVVLADNPSKFVIQLLLNKCELKKLNCELSGACNSYKGPRLDLRTIKIGQIYAAKYDEYVCKWYRVYLLKVTDTNRASVYYCDYGYYKEVNIEDILPLKTQFHQLPYQAIWAELYGIKPVFERWTIDDASRFKDLTQLKDFVCLIKSKKSFKPKNYQALMPITVETVYSLELVDTSTAQDIYIADVLVDERRALKCK